MIFEFLNSRCDWIIRLEALRSLRILCTLHFYFPCFSFSISFASQRVTFCGKSNQNHWGEVICLVTDSACAGGVWAILPPQTPILILLFVGIFRFDYDDEIINKQTNKRHQRERTIQQICSWGSGAKVLIPDAVSSAMITRRIILSPSIFGYF